MFEDAYVYNPAIILWKEITAQTIDTNMRKRKEVPVIFFFLQKAARFLYERSQIRQSKNFRGQIRHEESIQFPHGIRRVLKIFSLRDIVVCLSLLKRTTSQACCFLLSRFNEQIVEARTIVKRLHLHERNTIIVLKLLLLLMM